MSKWRRRDERASLAAAGDHASAAALLAFAEWVGQLPTRLPIVSWSALSAYTTPWEVADIMENEDFVDDTGAFGSLDDHDDLRVWLKEPTIPGSGDATDQSRVELLESVRLELAAARGAPYADMARYRALIAQLRAWRAPDEKGAA